MAISPNKILASALAVAAGCTGNTSGNTTEQCAALTATSAKPPPGWNGSVFTVVMENHSRPEIVNAADAPYINSLLKDNALAVGYHDPYVHPSEPNYFWMVAGENFGILDDNDPASHHIESTSHIADQLELADLTWKSYQESMGAPCGLVSKGRYAAKHNPFVYFNDVNGWDGTQFHPEGRCNDHVVDYSQLDADIAANKLPKYAFITPNLDDDMHDGPVSLGDKWLSTELPKIMATDAFKNGGVIFLLWDEGSSGPLGDPADDPPFIAISPYAVHGMVSKTQYDTSSYLKTVQQILGLDQLPCDTNAASVQSMSELFTQPTTTAHP
jgi:phospholipase C